MRSSEKQAAVLTACAGLLEKAPEARGEIEELLFTAALAWQRWNDDHDADLRALLLEHDVALPAVRLTRRCLRPPADVFGPARIGIEMPSGAFARPLTWCGTRGPYGVTDPVLVTCPGCRQKMRQGLIRHFVTERDGRDTTACGRYIRTNRYIWIGLPGGERPGEEYSETEHDRIVQERFQLGYIDEHLRTWLGDCDFEIEGTVHRVSLAAEGEGNVGVYTFCDADEGSDAFPHNHGVDPSGRWDGMVPPHLSLPVPDPDLPRCPTCFGESLAAYREDRARIARLVEWMRPNVKAIERKVTPTASLTTKRELVTCKNCLKKLE